MEQLDDATRVKPDPAGDQIDGEMPVQSTSSPAPVVSVAPTNPSERIVPFAPKPDSWNEKLATYDHIEPMKVRLC